MRLFYSDSQRRETYTIAGVLSIPMFWGGLSRSHPHRWFGVNIPMSYAGHPAFDSDVDIVGKLMVPPACKQFVYRAWEVKACLLLANGTAKSLKNGKVKKTVNQLSVYRDFGVPSCSLLEVYLCEDGMLKSEFSFPPVFYESIDLKARELCKEGFGYDVIVFGNSPSGVLQIVPLGGYMNYVAHLLEPETTSLREPFASFADRLEASAGPSLHVVYCGRCKDLLRVVLRRDFRCPKCNSNLDLWMPSDG